jgi:hypothetical protein
MNDAIDMGMDTADDVEAADKVYAQICDEIGVDMDEVHDVGKNKLAMGESNQAGVVIIILVFNSCSKIKTWMISKRD